MSDDKQLKHCISGPCASHALPGLREGNAVFSVMRPPDLHRLRF
jgi:hypothetical protein